MSKKAVAAPVILHNMGDVETYCQKRHVSFEKKNKIPADTLESLIRAVNKAQTIAPTLAETILDVLASARYHKQDFNPPLNIQKLVKSIRIPGKNLSIKSMINVLHGCGRLAYDRDELLLEGGNLAEFVNLNIAAVKPFQAVTFMHALAKLGYKHSSNHMFKAAMDKLALVVQGKLDSPGMKPFNHRMLADIVHSYAKMEMFDALFDIKQKLHAALTPEQIAKINSHTAFSLLQAQELCETHYGEGFFDDDTVLSNIAKHVMRDENPPALIKQNKIAYFLESMGGKVDQEVSLRQTGGVAVREIDIRYVINGKTYYIEFDGPTHYLPFNETSHRKDSATRSRDILNKKLIAQVGDDNSYYLTLRVSEVEEYLNNPAQLRLFLTAKLENEAQKVVPVRGVGQSVYVSEKKEEVLTIDSISLQDVSGDETEMTLQQDSSITEIFSHLLAAKNIRDVRMAMANVRSRINEADENGKTMLHLAIEHQQSDLARKLIALGADARTQSLQQETPLHLAAGFNMADVVLELVTLGAVDIDARCDGKTALEFALEAGQQESIEVLAPRMHVEIVEEIAKQSPGAQAILEPFSKKGQLNIALLSRLHQPQFMESSARALAKTAHASQIMADAYGANPPQLDIIAAMIKGGVALSPSEMLQQFEMAVLHNQQGVIEAFLSRGIDINQQWPNIGLPIKYAIEHQYDIGLLNQFLKAGANIMDSGIGEGAAQELLAQSLQQGHLEIASALIAFPRVELKADMLENAVKLNALELVEAIIAKPNFNNNSKAANKAIAYAVNAKNIEIFDALVGAGVGLQGTNIAVDFILQLNSYGDRSALVKVLQYFKDQGAGESLDFIIEQCNQDGSLHMMAMQEDCAKSIGDLIDLGFDPNNMIYGATPLAVAADFGHIDVVNVIVEKMKEKDAEPKQASAKSNSKSNSKGKKKKTDGVRSTSHLLNDLLETRSNRDGSNALHRAAMAGHVDIVESLLAAAGDESDYVNSTYCDGVTALHVALQHGHTNVVNALLNHPKIDLCAVTTENRVTPLHMAARCGYEENFAALMSKILERDDAQSIINSQVRKGPTALYSAAEAGHKHVVERLIAAGADINAPVANRSTAAFIAINNGHPDIADILIQHPDIDVNVVSSYKDVTMLHLSLLKGYDDISKTLIKKGALQSGADNIIRAAMEKGLVEPTGDNMKVIVDRDIIHAENLLSLIDVSYSGEITMTGDGIKLLIDQGVIPQDSITFQAVPSQSMRTSSEDVRRLMSTQQLGKQGGK